MVSGLTHDKRAKFREVAFASKQEDHSGAVVIHLTALSERHMIIDDIGKARREGARLGRWTQGDEVRSDGHPTAVRPPPAHQLSEAECAGVLRVCSEPRFASRQRWRCSG